MIKKIKINKKVRVIVIIISVIIIINVIYNIGKMRGLIEGVGFTANKLNSSTCDILNKTRDKYGYCVLKTGAKYEVKLNCPFEDFVVKGKKELGTLLYAAYLPQKVFFYPFTGCW